jgi:hypothetical protein
MNPTTFFAIALSSRARGADPRRCAPVQGRIGYEGPQYPFNWVKSNSTDVGRPKRDTSTLPSPCPVDLLHGPGEVGEGSPGHFHHLADLEGDLLLLLLLARQLHAQDLVHLLVAEGLGLGTGAHELDDPLDRVDGVLGALVQDHLHEHVPGVETSGDLDALSIADLGHLLGGNQDLLDLPRLRLLLILLVDLELDELLDLVLVARVALDRVPPGFCHVEPQAPKMPMMTSMKNREAMSMIQMTRDTRRQNTITTRVAFLSCGQSGQVTRWSSTQHSWTNSPVCFSRVTMETSPYFVSLWTVCLRHRGQNFRYSTRSGWRRLFFVWW